MVGEFIGEAVGAGVEWLLYKLPKGCAILLGLALFVGLVALIVWFVSS